VCEGCYNFGNLPVGVVWSTCTAEQVMKNGSNPDAQASPLQTTVCVVQMPSPEKMDSLT